MGSCGRAACNLAKAVCPQVPRERAGGCAWLAELGEYLLRREELVQRFVARADRCAIVAGAEGSARVVPIVGLAGCVALPREDLAGSSAGLTAMLGAAFDLAVLRWTVPLGDFVEWPEA